MRSYRWGHLILAGMALDMAYLAASIDGYSSKSKGWRLKNKGAGFSVDCLLLNVMNITQLFF
jgi:hypothetical protein